MATQPIPLDFGPWLPDLPDHDNPGCLVAKNVIPESSSYRPVKGLASITDGIGEDPLGFIWVKKKDDTLLNYVGTPTDIFALNSYAWTSVGKSGGYTAADNWEFTKFGDRIIAVSKNQPSQYVDFETAVLPPAGAGDRFADLPNAPRARRVATVRDFVVMGDLVESSISYPNRVRWSGALNTEAWAPSVITQSGSRNFRQSAGGVQKIVGGEFGLIFLEQSIFRLDYVGPPVVFQLTELERSFGTPAPNSVCITGRVVFFYAQGGFYVTDGRTVQGIGSNQVDEWFKENADLTRLESMRGAVDLKNQLVVWSFRSRNGTANDRLLIYSYEHNKWSYAELQVKLLGDFRIPGATLDTLDDILGPGGVTNSINMDTDQYAGGDLLFFGFDTSDQLATFSGDFLEAEIVSKEFGGQNGRRAFVNMVRPRIEGSPATGVTISAGGRDDLLAAASFGSARGLTNQGEAAVLSDRRFHRFRTRISGGFDHARGLDIFIRPNAGRR